MTADAEEGIITSDALRGALVEACPGTRVAGIRQLDAGYTSRQWVADTDEGPLLVKTPVRDTDPEHLRRLIATTRRAGEGGVPVVRFRAFVPRSTALQRPVLVQEFQEGTPADAAWESMDPAERTRFAAEVCALPVDWESRVRLGRAIHALSMAVYFLRWTPKWAPQYVRELEEWLSTQA